MNNRKQQILLAYAISKGHGCKWTKYVSPKEAISMTTLEIAEKYFQGDRQKYDGNTLREYSRTPGESDGFVGWIDELGVKWTTSSSGDDGYASIKIIVFTRSAEYYELGADMMVSIDFHFGNPIRNTLCFGVNENPFGRKVLDAATRAMSLVQVPKTWLETDIILMAVESVDNYTEIEREAREKMEDAWELLVNNSSKVQL